MRIASIVLHYRSLDDTIEAIRSLVASTISTNVFVVNNDVSELGHTDRLSLPDEFSGSAVQVIEAGGNRGFASGVNLGIQAALAQEADAIFLLNNDAVVVPTTLALLRDAAEECPEFGILAPVVYYAAAPTRVWSAGWRSDSWLRLLRPAALTSSPTRVRDAQIVAGCAMLIRRSAIERVGMFDERFFLYYEDVDLCQRAWSAGFRVGIVDEARAYHRVPEQHRLLERSRVYPWARSKALCYGRTPGISGSFTASLRLAVGIISFAVRCVLVGRVNSIPLYIKGTRDGWRVARSG